MARVIHAHFWGWFALSCLPVFIEMNSTWFSVKAWLLYLLKELHAAWESSWVPLIFFLVLVGEQFVSSNWSLNWAEICPFFFYQMGYLPNGSSVLPEESGTSQGLVIWFICPGWCLYAVVLDKLITNFVLQVSFDWASHEEETWSW